MGNKGTADIGIKGKIEAIFFNLFPKGKVMNKEEINKLVNTKIKATPKTVNGVLVDLIQEGKLKVAQHESGRRLFEVLAGDKK
jgi:hypothetical protein